MRLDRKLRGNAMYLLYRRYCHYRHEIGVTIAIYEYVLGIHN